MSGAGLNESQQQAVEHIEGPLVVFAGAGSGKTRVITYRIANLLENHGVAPEEILSVTFTNKAAGEMRERLRSLTPDADYRLTIGTFHSVCSRFLRRYADQCGVDSKFTIYDDQDQKQMVKRMLKDLDIDPKKLRLRRWRMRSTALSRK